MPWTGLAHGIGTVIIFDQHSSTRLYQTRHFYPVSPIKKKKASVAIVELGFKPRILGSEIYYPDCQALQDHHFKKLVNRFISASTQNQPELACNTKSRPLKSAMVRGRRVRPHTKRRKRERSAVLNSSMTSQNHCTRGEVASIPLYVATDFRRVKGMSGLPHTCTRKKQIR